MEIGSEKIGILTKKMWEGHFRRESKQGVLQESYRPYPLEFDSEILRYKI